MPPHKKGAKTTRIKRKQMIEPKDIVVPVYATVEKELGNCHFSVKCTDGQIKCASLTGSVKKYGKIRVGDFVMIQPISEDLDSKHQIVYRYTPEMKKILEKQGKIINIIDPSIQQNKNTEEDEEDENISFDYNSTRDQLKIVAELFSMAQIDDL